MTTKPETEMKEVQRLIDRGKERGFLTYEEVNDALPSDVVSADQLDTMLSMFDDLDIDIIDNEEEAKRTQKGEDKPKEEEKETETTQAEVDEAAAGVRTTDPVR
ncbi:MAG: RNA polymerase sigma factor region1.1 domain-containing protein, partial [Deltaproteobacteria bacterium]|nr:RNA polymerase sigma factor region1.1 domain-containing protein [Deltaproteobacteria bacterium]